MFANCTPSGLVNPTEMMHITGDVARVFNTFSNNRTIIIYKESIKTPIAQQPTDGIFGFGTVQDGDLFTYTAVSGVFNAIVKYDDIQTPAIRVDGRIVPEPVARVYAKEVQIKVQQPARDFINNGKTEKVILDGLTYIIDGDESFQTFLGTQYFVFHMRETK